MEREWVEGYVKQLCSKNRIESQYLNVQGLYDFAASLQGRLDLVEKIDRLSNYDPIFTHYQKREGK